jgi:hypothetical protein
MLMAVLIEATFVFVNDMLGSRLVFRVGTDIIDVAPGPIGLVSVPLK